MISARIELDSVNEYGNRLTTFILTFPKMFLAEFNTHRMVSRNSASSRAMPTSKILNGITYNPVLPLRYLANQPGMQGGDHLNEETQEQCEEIILEMRDACMRGVQKLHSLGLHKQSANRYLEPWMYTTIIASATEWSNFFALRNHPMAQPEFHELARQMEMLYNTSTPKLLKYGEWHTPLIREDDPPMQIEKQLQVSVGRCARVSYLTHDGRRDIEDDIRLFHRLADNFPMHSSPLEHVAESMTADHRSGNFVGWRQYRKYFSKENITKLMLKEMRENG